MSLLFAKTHKGLFYCKAKHSLDFFLFWQELVWTIKVCFWARLWDKRLVSNDGKKSWRMIEMLTLLMTSEVVEIIPEEHIIIIIAIIAITAIIAIISRSTILIIWRCSWPARWRRSRLTRSAGWRRKWWTGGRTSSAGSHNKVCANVFLLQPRQWSCSESKKTCFSNAVFDQLYLGQTWFL